MTKAHHLKTSWLIDQGRANTIQSAKRLQEISKLEEIVEELAEALTHVAYSSKFQCYDDESWNIVNSALQKASKYIGEEND